MLAASPNFPPANAFQVGMVALCGYAATATTLVDALASRNVADALSLLSVAGVLAATFWYDYDAWMAEDGGDGHS